MNKDAFNAENMTRLSDEELLSGVRRRVAVLHALKKLLEDDAKSRAPRDDRQGFSALFNTAQIILEANDEEVSQRLGMLRSTIDHWSRAETCPYPNMRANVCGELAAWTGEKLQAYEALKNQGVLPQDLEI